MADDSDTLGDVDDVVSLTLGGSEILIAESYEVNQAFLEQPSKFQIKIGSGDLARTIVEKFPPRTAFTLKVGDAVRQTGFTDGYELEDGGGATEVTIRGRDNLSALHDAYITADQSFTNVTFADLVQKALDATGYTDRTLRYTNEANRKILSGTIGATQTAAPRDASQDDAGSPIGDVDNEDDSASKGAVQRALQAKVGERWYGFLKRVLDTAGFFLWCAGDGTFILSEPNANQKPMYRIARQRGALRNAVNVTHAHLTNDTASRYTEAIVYARGGGRKFGRQKAKGTFTDDEMIALGFNRPIVAKDVNVTNVDQAAFYARRRLAEARRNGFKLEYTVSGHTVPSLLGGSAVWTPDTIIDVQDDEFGLHQSFWLEGVIFRRDESGGTSTQLTLVDPSDLVFATNESPTS